MAMGRWVMVMCMLVMGREQGFQEDKGVHEGHHVGAVQCLHCVHGGHYGRAVQCASSRLRNIFPDHLK